MTKSNKSETNTNQPESRAAVASSGVESLNVHRQALEPGHSGSSRRIAPEDLDQIVRRAAEFQHKHGEPGSQLLSEQEVIEIGRQVGLEPAHVRRAIAEVRADSLAPKQPPAPRLLSFVAGPSRVEVRRVVEGEPDRIQRQLELVLRDQEKLTAVRQRPMRSLWEPSGGLLAKLERGLNFSGKGYALANASQVDLTVAELEPGWTLVTLGADFVRERDEILWTMAGIVGFAMIFAGVLVGKDIGFFLGALVALLIGMVGVMAVTPWVRMVMGKRRARGELMLEAVLDQVDHQ